LPSTGSLEKIKAMGFPNIPTAISEGFYPAPWLLDRLLPGYALRYGGGEVWVVRDLKRGIVLAKGHPLNVEDPSPFPETLLYALSFFLVEEIASALPREALEAIKVGAEVWLERLRRGLTPKEMAQQHGIPLSSYLEVERGVASHSKSLWVRGVIFEGVSLPRRRRKGRRPPSLALDPV
jgi:hypothetical protein